VASLSRPVIHSDMAIGVALYGHLKLMPAVTTLSVM
jgi:hypothetical protein